KTVVPFSMRILATNWHPFQRPSPPSANKLQTSCKPSAKMPYFGPCWVHKMNALNANISGRQAFLLFLRFFLDDPLPSTNDGRTMLVTHKDFSFRQIRRNNFFAI
ncbi:MAG: hypothetical protein NT142_01350, partial [Planctomycetota bacterium]|nr:hypothetical protein [Planctomycetota bacterium]